MDPLGSDPDRADDGGFGGLLHVGLLESFSCLAPLALLNPWVDGPFRAEYTVMASLPVSACLGGVAYSFEIGHLRVLGIRPCA